jgi:N-hydroxyarylamine O-acetyltransferase
VDWSALLDRIGISSLPNDPWQRLVVLHQAIPRHVPFENIAILEGKPIVLTTEAIFEKIVMQRRGGYCFEINGLLLLLLESLGYQVDRLLGRVWSGSATTPALTHMALRVTVDGQQYLCDVGFGAATLRAPLRWQFFSPEQQQLDTYRLEPTDNHEVQLSVLKEHGWKPLYSLLPCCVRAQDYIPANHYTSTHPMSYFTQEPVAALATEQGRVTLRRDRFAIQRGSQRIEKQINEINELKQILEEHFGLMNLDWHTLRTRLQGIFPAR